MPPYGFAGSIPEKYERYLGPLLFEPYALDLADHIDPQQALSVLETACGTGRVTKHLRKRLLPEARLVATDLNQDMITVARSLYDDPAIEWEMADAQALPFPDDSFDLVVCQFGVMFMPDKPKAFAEAFRVLKKGGIFLFNTWDRIDNNSFMCTGINAIARFFVDIPLTFYRAPFSMYDEQELYMLSGNAGFENIRIALVKKEGSSPNARDIASGIAEGTPAYNEIKNLGEGKIQEIIDATEKAIALEHGDHPATGMLQAFVCRAEKR